MAVKKRPGLQSNTSTLLVCLAVTDLLTGLIAQPSFVAWKTFYVLKNINFTTVKEVHNYFLHALIISSSLHLTLVTCGRLIAIKYTNHYSSGAPNDNFRKIICSEDNLRSRIFGSFSVKFLACLPLLGFSNIKKVV